MGKISELLINAVIIEIAQAADERHVVGQSAFRTGCVITRTTGEETGPASVV